MKELMDEAPEYRVISNLQLLLRPLQSKLCYVEYSCRSLLRLQATGVCISSNSTKL